MPRLYVMKGVELRQSEGFGCVVPSLLSQSDSVANPSGRRSPSSPARTKDRVGLDGVALGQPLKAATLLRRRGFPAHRIRTDVRIRKVDSAAFLCRADSFFVQPVEVDRQSAYCRQILARVLPGRHFTISEGQLSAVVRKEAAHDEGAFGLAEPRSL